MSGLNTENTRNVLNGKRFTTPLVILFNSSMRKKNWRGARKTKNHPSHPTPVRKIQFTFACCLPVIIYISLQSLSFWRVVLYLQCCRQSSIMWTESLIQTCLQCSTLVSKCRLIKTVAWYCCVANFRLFGVLKNS